LNLATVAEPVEADGARQSPFSSTHRHHRRAKGVMLTHRNLLFSARGTAALRKMAADDVQYCVLPISHHRRHLAADDDLDGRRHRAPGR